MVDDATARDQGDGPADQSRADPGGTPEVQGQDPPMWSARHAGQEPPAPQGPPAAEERPAAQGPPAAEEPPVAPEPPAEPGPAAPRRWPLAVLTSVGTALVLLVGFGFWVSSQSLPVPGTTQASVLTPNEASALAGVRLTAGASGSEPPPPLAADPSDCAVAVGPGTRSVYARGWKTYLASTYQDARNVEDHLVTQVLGVYDDADEAGRVFRTLTEGLRSCPQATRTDQDQSTSNWVYTVEKSDTDTLSWTAAQDPGDGWVCYRQARRKGKAVLQVAVCQAGDGRRAAAQLADAFAAKVEG
ncbi:sensor domain-containing protein [Longispora urticae]